MGYRYVDWSITIPLQMIEFNLILKAAGKPVSGGMFWRLLVGTVIMLMFGYLGETFLLPSLWVCSAGSSFSTRSSQAKLVAPLLAAARPSRLPSGGSWSIYPLGYLFGYL